MMLYDLKKKKKNAFKFNNWQQDRVNNSENTSTSSSSNKSTILTWLINPNLTKNKREEFLSIPTIANHHAFQIWKNEAFSLWKTQWQNIYKKDSQSYQIIEQIINEYYLVTIIDNHYYQDQRSGLFSLLTQWIQGSPHI